MGVGPESPVGLCADRSPEMLIGLLGILKADGAYVPLDPTYPRERLAFMVTASGARVLVTQRRWSDHLPADPGRVLLDDLEGLDLGEGGEQGSEPALSPDHLAYLIFTSGSTGRPKAVAVSHGSLERYVAFVGEELALAPDDRVLQFASISFDTAAEEIFPCLSRGATLVLRSDEMLGSPAAFLDCCGAWGVTVLDLPTAYWSELAAALDAGEADLPAAVRAVVIGGEKASADRVQGFPADQHLRPDGGDDRRHDLRAFIGRRRGLLRGSPDRATGAARPGLRGGRGPAARAHRGRRGAPPRRPGPGPRILRAPRPDSGALRPRSLQR
jgi:non-ribosomal peptide synthetase component F